MRLMHEFKQLVDHRLKELPVRFQESRVLSNDVHDVGGDNGFVVFPAFHLCETEKFFDDSDQEALLGLFV